MWKYRDYRDEARSGDGMQLRYLQPVPSPVGLLFTRRGEGKNGRNGGGDAYRRGDRGIEFVRCANCGCVTHYRTLPGDDDPLVAVNFRMAHERLETVLVRYSNGKDA